MHVYVQVKQATHAHALRRLLFVGPNFSENREILYILYLQKLLLVHEKTVCAYTWSYKKYTLHLSRCTHEILIPNNSADQTRWSNEIQATNNTLFYIVTTLNGRLICCLVWDMQRSQVVCTSILRTHFHTELTLLWMLGSAPAWTSSWTTRVSPFSLA